MKEFKTVNEAIDWCETFGEWCGTVTVKLAVLGGRTWIPMEIEKDANGKASMSTGGGVDDE